MDETQRNSEQKLKGSMPSEESLCKLSMCFEEDPLQSHFSLKDSECFSTVGLRQNTPPTPGGPNEEREKSLHETEAKSIRETEAYGWLKTAKSVSAATPYGSVK